MFSDYNEWIQLQETAGGLPANLLGYCAMLLVKLIVAKDLRNPATIEPAAPVGKYLENIIVRQERPEMHRWPVPQRQSTLIPTASEFESLQERLKQFISRHHQQGVEIKSGKAFDSLNAYYLHGRELFHIHPVDKSLHCMFHPGDAKLVVEKGWAEWFGLAGKVGQQKGTVLFYAVRGAEEIDMLEQVWEAAVTFVEKELRIE
jgi:hypothetical protein